MCKKTEENYSSKNSNISSFIWRPIHSRIEILAIVNLSLSIKIIKTSIAINNNQFNTSVNLATK
jgi:hypothetical protein